MTGRQIGKRHFKKHNNDTKEADLSDLCCSREEITKEKPILAGCVMRLNILSSHLNSRVKRVIVLLFCVSYVSLFRLLVHVEWVSLPSCLPYL